MAEGVTLNIGDFRTNTIFLFVIAVVVVVLLIRLKQFWEFPRRVLFTTSVFCWCYYFHFVFMGFVRILGFWDFFLWFVSMLLSSDTDGRTAGTDVSDSLSILQERNNRSRATQGDQFNVRWCIFSVFFFLIFNLRNQVLVFCTTLNGISRLKQCP